MYLYVSVRESSLSRPAKTSQGKSAQPHYKTEFQKKKKLKKQRYSYTIPSRALMQPGMTLSTTTAGRDIRLDTWD